MSVSANVRIHIIIMSDTIQEFYRLYRELSALSEEQKRNESHTHIMNFSVRQLRRKTQM